MRLLYITNIPAPYRQKRFNMMQRIFPDHGIEFEVLYMAKIEPNRKWIIPNESFNYPYKIFKGIHPTIGRFFAHFNPGLLLRLLKNDYDVAIVGGMASPTHWLAPFFISKRKVQVMSIESNLHSVVRKGGIGARFKSVLLNRANAYQITGQPQKEYIQFFQPKACHKPFILLPNLIDEEIFVNQVSKLRIRLDSLRQEFGVAPNEQMWIIPSRLIEIKGIVPFIKSLGGLSGFRLYILGDGEQSNEIKDIISSYKLPVFLTGFLQQDQVIKYYAAADLFILPSFKDPSPLSPIEAIAAELPILVSKRIGNINEVLNESNGWAIEPGNQKNIRQRAIDILTLSRDELRTMGNHSRSLYKNFFDTENCINRYAIQLNNLMTRQ